MTLCYPDRTKSCAACCGLYNVADATRPTLEKKLKARTALFGQIPRNARALMDFERFIGESEASDPVDQAIHVCEFTGFLDEECKTVGCLLHPTARGNGGIDLRGLCHYGSMACKAFFCPASDFMDPTRRDIVVHIIDDWHLYGLVATDVDFVESLFRLIEDRLQRPLTRRLLDRNPDASKILKEMFRWKTDWPMRGGSLLRQSRYYFKRSEQSGVREPQNDVERLLACIRFTYGKALGYRDEGEVVARTLAGLVRACSL